MEPHHHVQLHRSSSSLHAEATDNRFPQWSVQETKEFLMIRAELDRSFMETKRNKLLWEDMSTRMRDKGFNRSPEQCKCKWKNLVTRYKWLEESYLLRRFNKMGCETAEAESMRQQFPFYTEMHAIFAARMQRMLWIEAEGAGSASHNKRQLSSDDDQEDNDVSDAEFKIANKKKAKKGKFVATSSDGGGRNIDKLKEIMEEFIEQQMRMELQWREACEAREEERRMKEMEWRRTMEALEKERLMMEKRWKEREEQRRLREEARAENRDALITAVLNKLRREEMQ